MKLLYGLILVAVTGVYLQTRQYPVWAHIPWGECLFSAILLVVMGMGAAKLMRDQ